MLVVNNHYPVVPHVFCTISMQAPFIPFRDTFSLALSYSRTHPMEEARVAPSLPHPTSAHGTLPCCLFPIMTFMQAGLVVLSDDVWV